MQASSQTLFHSLGGERLVRAMMTELTNLLITDERINHYFIGIDHLTLRENLFAFFSSYVLGGPDIYDGPSLRSLKAYGITEEEYNMALLHVQTALKNHHAQLKETSSIQTMLYMIKNHMIYKS